MTVRLYTEDAYATRATGTVIGHTQEGGVLLDQCLFYATGGGQPGDGGTLNWPGGRLAIATAIKVGNDQIALIPDGQGPLPEVGVEVDQELDWDRRFAHMRVHTMLHLLSVVIPLDVSGGSISPTKGRLDFNMPDAPPDKTGVESALQALIDRDLPVSEDWITETELDANPGLVKTMSVSPPRGAGRIRLVRIGQGDAQVDLQPCGGTHVSRTGEIGRIRVGKVEKKGRLNRRVYVHLDQ
jgi:misacylated tRNA(Ala) deacylase